MSTPPPPLPPIPPAWREPWEAPPPPPRGVPGLWVAGILLLSVFGLFAGARRVFDLPLHPFNVLPYLPLALMVRRRNLGNGLIAATALACTLGGVHFLADTDPRSEGGPWAPIILAVLQTAATVTCCVFVAIGRIRRR